MKKDAGLHELIHFVFSCRIMNMGIEQYIFQKLGEPHCKIVEPVSNPIKCFEKVDWISENNLTEDGSERAPAEKLLLFGGCDLLQVANYCSSNRVEYVNIVRNDTIIRYDDFGFILNSRDRIRASSVLPMIPCWSANEVEAFDRDLADARIIIVSLWVALRGKYLVTDDGVVVRIHPYGLGQHIDEDPEGPFLKRSRIFKLTMTQNGELLRQSFHDIIACSPNAKYRVIVGSNTRKVSGESQKSDKLSRQFHNDVALDYAKGAKGFDYISIDNLVPVEEMLDDWHPTRKGYYLIAQEILKRKDSTISTSAATAAHPRTDIAATVSCGIPVRMGRRLGPPHTKDYYLRQARHTLSTALDILPGGRLALRTFRFLGRLSSGALKR
jgi:hypothetical protein